MTDIQRLAAVLNRQRTAFQAELPVSIAVRKDRLKRAVALLVDHADAFAAALTDDFGHRSREQSLMTDIVSSIRQMKHAIRNVESWSARDRRKLDFPLGLLGAKGWVEYQPKGVVGVIAPWNFPVQLTMGPIAGAFAAGNRVMAKSSEYTPAVAALFERVTPDYFDESELAFFSGGPEVGKAFSELPFDHLIFTGATGIGRHILHAAADNLTPVTLELGGKSPTIIGRSADLPAAMERIALGKMMNAGQICLAPDYLLVPDEKEDAVVDGLKRAVASLYPSLLDNPDYTSVINARHAARLAGHLDDARAKGADVVEVNPAGEDFAASNGNKMPLYIVRGATDEMTVMQEEIFGPILPVMRYDRIDQAIDYVNAHDRPLGLYYFGADADEERRVLDRTISGGATVNDVLFHVSMEELPFGGIGPSGMGHYHGRDGFRTFSHARSVYKQPKIDIARIAGFKPPYGAGTRKAIARDLKR
ncbi:MAG: aldehyde dehydrogenase [Sphingomonas sp. SCN 67-18]|uniref:coniferyl aldehyde dehydrogenase n=1 Tax=uncultured Sphingomonas sp. TaxID=158754 RepID=UPI00086F3DF3|nr:coniferyl aldehyde dehydrogenase [Sphingomonas sp. SCN 67-18]ODU19900.1 MAG: aldehyde dehydrogenase [Sphingomonas sp. SCN 67-18]